MLGIIEGPAGSVNIAGRAGVLISPPFYAKNNLKMIILIDLVSPRRTK
jgi:hypothetical protein